MTTTEDAPELGTCELCKRTGQALATEYRTAGGPRVVCADAASCAHAQRAVAPPVALPGSTEDFLGMPDARGQRRERPDATGQGRSAYRDEAEQLCAQALEARGQMGHVGIVLALCGATQALLAVAEAITQAPATDLVGVLDAGLDGLRSALAQAGYDYTPDRS